MSDNRENLVPRGRSLSGQPSDRLDFIFETFDTLNTKPLRPAIKDNECYICDGFMLLGPSNARTLYGIGPILYTAPIGKTVVWHRGCNIGEVSGHAVLLSDGSLQFINDLSESVSQIMPPGTILNPSTIIGFSQWSSPTPLLVFAKDQTNGYWLWDGTSLFTAGTISPEVNITNSGENYTGPATLTVHTTGAGSGVQFTQNIQNNSLSLVTVSAPGANFALEDFVTVQVAGGGSDDQCYLTANISPPTVGGIDEVIVNLGGSGYTGATTILALGGGGSNASLSFVANDGIIESVAVINPGVGYTSPPTIIADDPGYPGAHIPGGVGFSAFCTIAGGQITGLNIIYGGTNYITPPTLTIVGDGTGAEVVAQISGGVVSGFVLKNFGSGYTKALVDVSGGNNAASLSISLMPFGISGTTVETYNNQIWIGNGSAAASFPPRNRVVASQPGSASGFDPTQGAVAFTSNNATLRVGYHALIQTNGFLYEIGDSGIDQISGVQSSASGAQTITTFNNINTDPQIGTPWPSSIQLLNRDIVLANTLGVFVAYGGAVAKISEPLDGFYASGPIFGPTANFSSAVAQIFGRYVYMLLLPIIDPNTGAPDNKLLMWDGKRWWTSDQDVTLTYISTQEINSVMTAWGTDGSRLFPLFSSPSTKFTKTLQSKLWATPGYDSVKMAMHLLGIINFYNEDEPISVSVDSEMGTNSSSQTIVLPGFLWTNNGAPFIWTNNSQPFIWSGTHLVAFGPVPVGGYVGRLIGMTVKTEASDVAILSAKLVTQVTSLMP